MWGVFTRLLRGKQGHIYAPVSALSFQKFDMHLCCHGKPPSKYIYFSFGLIFLLLLLFFWFYLSGVESVAPRARFKCVWVFKDFSAEKLFGSKPFCHTCATELCHFRFSSLRRNERKVQRRSKKHKTKADENGPDWIMSDLACSPVMKDILVPSYHSLPYS